jgi:fatty-acyl-CoA synthase
VTTGSIIEWLGRVVSAQPNRPATITEDGSWTYAQLWQRAARVAFGLLRSNSFDRGDRVGLLGKNSPDYLAAYLGIMRAGGIVVPLNDRESGDELNQQLQFIGASGCVICEAEPSLAEAAAATRSAWSVSELNGSGVASLPSVGLSEDACIILTSGSTGAPKGVRHSHATLFHEALQLAIALPFARDDVNIAFLPFFAAIPEQVIPTLLVGASLYVMPRFEVDSVCEACSLGTTFDAVPTVVARLLEDGDCDRLRSLRWIAFASEPMPPAVLERWWERVPDVETHQFYGMTEVVPISHADPAAMKAQPGTVGSAFPTSQIEIVGDNLEPVEVGEEGEVTCKSPALTPGYFEDESATLAALTPSGAIRTGDLGRVDENGRLFLTGRLKDLIISGGFNVAPAEIEAAACRHQEVAAAAVVGVPDERWGETPVVVAVPKRGSPLTAHELLSHCRKELTDYKRPSAAAIVSELPVTGIGKSAKAQLRQDILDGDLQVVRLAKREKEPASG